MPAKIARPRKKPSTSTRKRAASLDFRAISRLARVHAGVTESTSYGAPSLKVDGQFMASVRPPRPAEREATDISDDGLVLVLRCDFPLRSMLLDANPRAFFITDHFRDYPGMVVNLERVSENELKDLLAQAHAFVSGTGRKRPRRNK